MCNHCNTENKKAKKEITAMEMTSYKWHKSSCLQVTSSKSLICKLPQKESMRHTVYKKTHQNLVLGIPLKCPRHLKKTQKPQSRTHMDSFRLNQNPGRLHGSTPKLSGYMLQLCSLVFCETPNGERGLFLGPLTALETLVCLLCYLMQS